MPEVGELLGEYVIDADNYKRTGGVGVDALLARSQAEFHAATDALRQRFFELADVEDTDLSTAALLDKA